MKIKDLRDKIKDLPDDMDVVLYDSHDRLGYEGYNYQVRPIRKAKTKLVKKIGDIKAVQSRPHRDEEAELALIIE
jgi:hypothetical protein